MKTKQLAIDAMLAAMCVALSFVSINLGQIKFTFESFPILLGALFLGPVNGLIVALVGTSIIQILEYGLMSTTILWVAPYIIYAVYVGLLRKRNLWFVVITGAIVLTLATTLGMYLDSIIWDYFTVTYIVTSFVLRFIASIVKSIVFVLIIQRLWNSIEKVLKNSQN